MRHDWFHSYSDDNNVWRRGQASMNALKTEARGVSVKEQMLADFTLYVFHGGPQPKLEDYENAQRQSDAAQANKARANGSRPAAVAKVEEG